MTIQKIYHHILIVGSIIGLLASFVLTVDTIKFIENPDVNLPCNINPFISCTSVASTAQSKIFGFPNSLLGITAFAMLFAIGVMLLSGGRAKKPLWLLVNLGTLAAMVFVMWFFFESVYRIGSLCIYCMTVWAVTWPLFLYTTVWNFRENHFSIEATSKKSFLFLKTKHQKGIDAFFHFISRNHTQILIAWYLIIIILILFRFRYFFFA
jgi:uncharacterized membrane protein